MMTTTVAIAPAQWVPAALGGLAALVWAMVVLRRGKAQAQAPAPAEAAPIARESGAAKRRAKAQARRRSLLIVGFAVAGTVWLASGRTGVASAVLIAWYASIVLLQARQRNKEMAEEEGHALAAIGTASRALRAGIPLAGVIEILAKESRGDAGAAFREIAQREALGEELPSAVRRVLLASTIPSMRAFGLALLLQLSAGGNIADTAERLGHSLVERNRVRRRARTLVAYGRAAAFLLSALPLTVIPLMSTKVEGYAQFLFDRPTGNLMLALSASLIAAGLVIVQRMCRIDQNVAEEAA
jgi:Flp pilus assembly protein TadB